MARLPRLMGRGRALEVLLGADDISGDLAELYGYVNPSLPDAELDAFVESLAVRIASFDKRGDRRDQALRRRGQSGARLRDRTGVGCVPCLDRAAGRAGENQDAAGAGISPAG